MIHDDNENDYETLLELSGKTTVETKTIEQLVLRYLNCQ